MKEKTHYQKEFTPKYNGKAPKKYNKWNKDNLMSGYPGQSG